MTPQLPGRTAGVHWHSPERAEVRSLGLLLSLPFSRLSRPSRLLGAPGGASPKLKQTNTERSYPRAACGQQGSAGTQPASGPAGLPRSAEGRAPTCGLSAKPGSSAAVAVGKSASFPSVDRRKAGAARLRVSLAGAAVIAFCLPHPGGRMSLGMQYFSRTVPSACPASRGGVGELAARPAHSLSVTRVHGAVKRVFIPQPSSLFCRIYLQRLYRCGLTSIASSMNFRIPSL